MILYPAMDLIAGRIVRLRQGRFDEVTFYEPAPADALRSFAEAGAEWAHVVDLDGAKAGEPAQHHLLKTLAAASPLRLQVAGGVRSAKHVAALLHAGASRVVVGSLAVRDAEATLALLQRFGPERITLSLDVRVEGEPMVATHGWQEDSGLSLWDVAARYPEARHLLLTDIGRDGMLEGPNHQLLEEAVARLPHLAIQASGGVTSLDDIRRLTTGGAILGRAMWEGRLTLVEALLVPAARIIPCLDVANGRVVKGVRFRDHREVGDIVEHALRYSAEGADELVFYEIKASAEGRSLELGWVRDIADVIDIPFCVAGGIRDRATAAAVLEAGADKVSINSPALETPTLITELAADFGSQCIVVGIDSLKDSNGAYRVKQYTGDPQATRDSGRLTVEWAREAVERGAGEIVLNAMTEDGVRAGYDLVHARELMDVISVPLIVSGGAGRPEHFREAFAAGASGALAATVFHDRLMELAELKRWLADEGVEVRL